jgi:hypothetical protein
LKNTLSKLVLPPWVTFYLLMTLLLLRATAPSSDSAWGYVFMWIVGRWCGWASGRLVNRYMRSCESECVFEGLYCMLRWNTSSSRHVIFLLWLRTCFQYWFVICSEVAMNALWCGVTQECYCIMPGGVIGLLVINHFIGFSEYLKGYVGSARDWYDHVYM